MKKILFAIIASAFFCGKAEAQPEIQLPKPQTALPTTLMQALAARHSVRNFSDKEIPLQELSNLLWAANGVNRTDGRRTAPSAINAQDIDIYVVSAKGAYLYRAEEHALVAVTDRDLRKAVASGQSFAATAPIALVLVSDAAKFSNPGAAKFGDMDAGYVSQNICLYCVAAGIGTVPRAIMDAEALKSGLKLKETQRLCLNHPVGYSAE